MQKSHIEALDLLSTIEWHYNKTIKPAIQIYRAAHKKNKKMYEGLLSQLFINFGDISGDGDIVIRMYYRSRTHWVTTYTINFTYEHIEVRWEYRHGKAKKHIEFASKFFDLQDANEVIKFLEKAYDTEPQNMPRGPID